MEEEGRRREGKDGSWLERETEREGGRREREKRTGRESERTTDRGERTTAICAPARRRKR
jgi:hypothetical protein